MRKSNSEFQTKFISEEGTKIYNKDYFGYAELDKFACYVLADSLDEDRSIDSGKLVVESIIRGFTENPSMGKGEISRYIKQAHQELKKNQKGFRLKASVSLVITDYKQARYTTIGNSRCYFLRNARFFETSKDHSLTRNLVEAEKIEQDKVALHEERNNLYAYLGQDERFTPKVSKKIRLEDGDILFLFSRGIWEYCDDGELLDAAMDETEAADVINNVEELILSKQPQEIDNYTLAVTFINKVYKNPKKKLSLKKVLMILLPVLMIGLTVGGVFFMNHRKKQTQTAAMTEYMESGERYLQYDNFLRASEDYKEALTLAKGLNKEAEKKEIDEYLILTEQILLGDGCLQEGDYEKAMEIYKESLLLSYQAGNVGKKYIEGQMERAAKYIEVYECLEEGSLKEGYDDLTGARAAYTRARELAAGLYFSDGKKEAADKIAAIDETITKLQQASEAAKKQQADEEKQAAEARQKETEEALQEEERLLAEEIEKELKEQAILLEMENQARLNDQKNAMEFETRGNELMTEGDYESAIVYFETARDIYLSLGMYSRSLALDKKIEGAAALKNQPAE